MYLSENDDSMTAKIVGSRLAYLKITV